MTSTVFPGPDKSLEIKKGHVCPPSNATHPADRWETAFVYTFICKFTKLRQEMDGFITVEDLEEALLFDGPHQILEQILARFMLNLRPQTRNIGPDVISSTVVAYFAEMFTKGERSNFWDEKLMINIGPFTEEHGDYFKLPWDKKLRILRQLIEWQLCYSADIKGLIDRAWGVVHMKHKKSTTEIAQETQELPESDPFSKNSIITAPLGQDAKKKRYWAIDLSPRLYLSTNPWKVTASFTKIASTKEDYLKIIEDLKESAPPPVKEGERRQKSDVAHINLIKLLESRIEAIDAESQRVAKARKKFLQKQVAAAQVAEMSLRGTRTRRAAQKPDYVYFNGEEDDEEEDFNDDAYEDRMDDEADFINDDPLSDVDEEDYMGGYARTRRSRRAAAIVGTERRRSTRSGVVNANGNRITEWQGERRSARLGAQVDQPPDSPPAKRRRMTESTASSLHEDQMEVDVESPKATALRRSEVALPQIAGKRGSKYWFYAVEPNPNAISTPVGENPPVAGPSEPTEGGMKSSGAASNGNAPFNITTESLVNGQASRSPETKAEVWFRGCLHTRRRIPKFHAPYATVHVGTSDLDLIPYFDHVKAVSHRRPSEVTGLFHYPLLTGPSQFKVAATLTTYRAQRLVNRIAQAGSSLSEMRAVVKNLDRLSDMLCSIIDLSELVRSAHPDMEWSESANEAHEELCEFMAFLNTEVGLSDTLNKVLSNKDIVKDMSPEEYQTAVVFWRDFVKSGLNLSPKERESFVSLSSEINTLGRLFLTEVGTPRPVVTMSTDEVVGTDGPIMSRLKHKSSTGKIQVQPGSAAAQIIMHSPSEDVVRRKVYLGSKFSTPEQLQILERLLRARGELARLAGKDSFSHLVLEDKMAKSPENVQQFLDMRMTHTQARVSEAVQIMSLVKKKTLGLAQLPRVYAWDRQAFTPLSYPSPPIPIPAPTAGRVFMGLSRLFRRLYGISFRPAEIDAGEVWHGDVRKLEVVHEDEGVIGWIYVDLYQRANKAGGAAHYTVVCSRRTDNDDDAGDFTDEDIKNGGSVDQLLQHLRFNRYTVKGRPGTWQLPVVVLLFDLARPLPGRPAYLEWQDVLTLCHEMGHAIHSMLGRTGFQNISGTRCATDFVEIPSILMEYFLTSPEVVTLFLDQGWTVGRKVPVLSPADHNATFAVLDSHTQLLYCYLDQLYHSKLPLDPWFSSTAVFEELVNEKSPIPYVSGTSWQTQFGHLYSYGAQYYSYMLDRAIAGKIWHTLFKTDPLSRKAGEMLKTEVLSYGGGRDPWTMVANVLDQPELQSGDKAAMKEVGRWSVEDDVAATMRL